jgi:hypothetical protein
MHLHHPQRPTIAHRLAFQGGMVVIPPPQIWHLEDDENLYEVSMMLPIKELSGFMAKWFRTTMHVDDLPDWLLSFRQNPEQCIMETFTNLEGGFTPNLDAKQTPIKAPAIKSPDFVLLDDL